MTVEGGRRVDVPPALTSLRDLIDRLAGFYGPLRMPPEDPFAFFVWDVLGTKTTSGRRDAAMAALRRIPALTPDAIRKVARGRIEAALRQCGSLVDERIAALDAGAEVFQRQPRLPARLHGPLREAWLAARDLPHLGHAGALALLLFAGNSRVVPVDEGIARLTARLGLVTPAANRRRLVREARRQLHAAIDPDRVARRRAVQYLQHHAQLTCVDGTPHCGACPLAARCEEGRRRRRPALPPLALS